MVYSGNSEKHANGVGIIMISEIAKSMMGFGLFLIEQC